MLSADFFNGLLAPAPSNSLFRGGFHGLALMPSGELATILRAPLDNPDTMRNLSSIFSRTVRLLLVDPSTGQPTAEYAVVMDDLASGTADLTVIDGKLHIVEESGCSGSRRLVRLDLDSATNLLQLGANAAQIHAGLEGTDPEDLATAFPIPVIPAGKTLVADLSAAGLSDGADFSLAQFEGELLFATSDAFGFPNPAIVLGDYVPCSWRLQTVAKPSFGRLELRSRGIDPSGQDGGAGLRSLPIQGLRQIVDIVTQPYETEGRVIRCIDGHLIRDLGVNIFEESARVSDLTLDTVAFPNAASLQSISQAGPLRVSKLDGDANGDGLYESLLAFGGRSVLALDEHLNVVHDSGDTIERQQRRYVPAAVPRLEASASTSGGRPAAAAMSTLGQSMAVAFEDAGVVAFFDLPLLWTGNLPTAPGAAPADVLFFDHIEAGSLRSYVLIADRANAALDVIEWEY
ncbi:MAG: hypothetical protein ACJA2W_002272 [Planctomycetota bacterium]